MSKKQDLISVVIPVFNTSKFLRKCLDSILNQTYKNLEVIVVNDCSTDESPKILEEYKNKDDRIVVVNHEKNRGLFRARISGISVATGDYISCVDSDDYISCDFYRRLLFVAQKEKADAVMCKAVHEDSSGYQYFHNSYYLLDDEVIEGESVLNRYLEQEGLCFPWHTIWNKIYKKSVWDKALPYLKTIEDHIIMCEDVLFSSILFTYINKLATTDYAYYFYMQHASASTAVNNNFGKFKKNIGDLIKCFNYVEQFYKSANLTKQQKQNFQNWKELYSRFWHDNVYYSAISESSKKMLLNILKEGLNLKEIKPTTHKDNYFYKLTTKWDKRYVDLCEKILDEKIKVVSFDIFDTVLTRPFFKPTDLFVLLDKEFDKLTNNSLLSSFSKIRESAERDVRNKLSQKEEITLDEIYAQIVKNYFVEQTVANKMKALEIEAELKYCKPRQSVVNLIEMAKYAEKKVVCTSDFYMGKEFLLKLLKKNGVVVDDIFISCEYGLTKNTGTLFGKVTSELSIQKSEILHIGDNWQSDLTNAKNAGLEAFFYASTKNAFMYEISDIKATKSTDLFQKPSGMWINYEKSLRFFETRCALALCANKIYDNPFYSYNEWSEFNRDSRFMGYYALGMHLWATSKWLYQENYNKKGNIHFVARDGYLPKLAYDILNQNEKARKSKYLYVSRKSLMPSMISSAEDLNFIGSVVNLKNLKPKKLFETFKPILKEEVITQFAGDFEEPFETEENACDFISKYLVTAYDKTKAENHNKNIKNYFGKIIQKGDVSFDIGYSGRTQLVLSKILGFNLDAYFIHANDDTFMARQKENNINIKCLYEYSPSVTGSAREVLISEMIPSCVGYNFENQEPIFEDKEFHYTAKFAISNIQKQAIKFVEDMMNTFGIATEFTARPMDLSMPYEYLLHCSSDNDYGYFSSYEFEDDLYEGKEKQNLAGMMQRDINYHHVMGYKKEYCNSNMDYQTGEQGVFAKVYKKLNRMFPVGTKRRKFAKKIGKLFVGKEK